MNRLTLTLPVTLIAHNILQVFITLDIILAYNIAGILNHLFGDTGFTGYLDGEARTRLTNRQLEQGLHLMAVVQHSTIHHTLVIVGKMLQVLIVSGNHAKGTLLPELLQHGLGNSTTNCGLGTATKLINQQQRVFVSRFHHLLHVHQMTRVCREIILNTLLVADINHNTLEDA